MSSVTQIDVAESITVDVELPPEMAAAVGPISLRAIEVADARGWSIEVAPVKREWMGAHDNFAYRCLPLTIANQAGWVIPSPCSFVAEWNGGASPADVRIHRDDPLGRYTHSISSHFGNGIVTVNVPWLFKIDRPGIGLRVGGLPNHPVFNATPCEGFVECDWLPFTWTMNWKIVRPGYPVQFAKGDPLVFLTPATLDLAERCEPTYVSPAEAPDEVAQFRVYDEARRAFNKNPDRSLADWQKFYTKGVGPAGQAPATHRTNVKVREFHGSRV